MDIELRLIELGDEEVAPPVADAEDLKILMQVIDPYLLELFLAESATRQLGISPKW